MNEAQQIFCLFYAVFFGVLMTSLPKRSFPTDKLFSKNWKKAWLRFALSIFFLNLIPAVQFLLTYRKFAAYTLDNSNTIFSAALVLILPAAAFGMFAFNRWYFASLVAVGDHAFPHSDKSEVLDGEESGWQHILGSSPYCVFLVLPWLVSSQAY